MLFALCRSSHPEVFLGKGVLEICIKFYRRTPVKFNGNKEMNSSQTHLLQTSSIILQVFRMSNDSQRLPISLKFSNFSLYGGLSQQNQALKRVWSKFQLFKLPIKIKEVHDRSGMISGIFNPFITEAVIIQKPIH